MPAYYTIQDLIEIFWAAWLFKVYRFEQENILE